MLSHPSASAPLQRTTCLETVCCTPVYSAVFPFLWHDRNDQSRGGFIRLHRSLLRRVGLPAGTALLMVASLLPGEICRAQSPRSISSHETGGAFPKDRPPSSQAAPVAPVPVPLDPSIASPLLRDPAARNQEILRHLNAVLRYWRQAESPMQKVGEPSDLIYRNQVVDDAANIAMGAFQSAQAEALLLQPYEQQSASSAEPSRMQRIQALRMEVAQRVTSLKLQESILLRQSAVARGPQVQKIQQALQQVQGEMELNNAIADALVRLTKDSRTKGVTALESQVKQVEATAPDLTNLKIRLAAPTLESLSSARDGGVITKAQVLFSLLNTRSSLDRLLDTTGDLRQQVTELRQPLILTLRATVARGEQMVKTPSPSEAAAAAKPSRAKSGSLNDTANVRKQYDDLTHNFQSIVAASVPLSNELLELDQMQAALQSWRASVDEEYREILTSLLTRVAVIAAALILIFVLGTIWRRITARYVTDLRRRRQWTVLRRLIMGFLTGIILIFGFVTQFSSLATFAGFITAGLAVGLQTILLSLAAYFFIIGRYGVRVGDRITIANVTGDVIEVGLLRFYVLEVASNGSLSEATGRIAIFSNAILFQALTPLYKQLPGTEYTWHQVIVKLASDKDYRTAAQRMIECVQQIYETYRTHVEHQHRAMENWMDMPLDPPHVQSSIQLLDGGLQLWIRYPAALRRAAAEDQKLSEALLQLIASDETVRAAVVNPPVIQASTK
ncbi:transporter, MscS family [Acidobacterium capsulatum ATCC 51196]|uniref:Transporter, MscS family n=1 Tax=Acidobacterium capsulatum (strain ATCC 51196 / DSM 11244 / BCRC 80197 / JCM 7670 / NBRC 15755 / NCIMB 13165 / 161) TaxID=240015 RepID=C1F3Y5_ACIC5|nr:transporter, MscS family [Acidobacterium capsulatum ATCC 51196]